MSNKLAEKIAHYCQKCGTPNSSGEINCRKCGTRLMIVVLPPSARHENIIAPTFYEDHLLERVSALELRLSQALEQLSRACELFERDPNPIHSDHLLITSFFESIEKINPEMAKVLRIETDQKLAEKQKVAEIGKVNSSEIEKIIGDHHEENRGLFLHLVEEGIKLLGANEEKQAFSTLERAALLSPRNVSLHFYLAKRLFLAERFLDAKIRLEIALEVEPQNFDVLLLLGTVYADMREAEDARKLLSVLANDPQSMFCVNYVWGVLAAYELKWDESLAAFNECSVEMVISRN